MCGLEALAAGLSKGREMRLPGGERLTAAEVGALATGMEYPVRLLLAAMGISEQAGSGRYLQAKKELRGWLWQHAAGEAAEKKWRARDGKLRLRELSAIVARELMAGERMSNAGSAEILGIDESNLSREPWRGRLEWMRHVGESIRKDAERQLKKQIY